MHTRILQADRPSRGHGTRGSLRIRLLGTTLLASLALACQPAGAQTEAGGTGGGMGTGGGLVAPAGPAIGGTLTAPPAPGGFTSPGGPSAILGDNRGRLGGIGFPFDTLGGVGAPGGVGVREPGWRITPSIGIEQEYNDNIRYTARNAEDDFITRITPGLLMNVDTLRLQGTLNYAPSAEFYWQNSDQNRLSHNGAGQFLATLVPDLLFLDARGAAGVRSLSGNSGTAPGTQASGARGDQVQTLSFSVSPYLVQRFGGWANARVGYVYQYVNEDRVDQNAAFSPNLVSNSFTPSEYSSHQAYGVLRTGENFGRYAGQFTVSGTTFVGSGLYEDAYKNIVLLENRYAITRAIAGLVEIGYETQHFNTVPVTDVEDVVWALGTRLTPTPESVIVAKYGQRDGFTSFFLDGSLAIGVRTRLFANYSERLTSSALNTGDLLGSTTLDPLGNPVDAVTGAPVLPAFANSSLASQSGLFREKVATASISQAWLRDTFTFSVSQTDRTPVANAPGQARPGFAQKSTNFTFSWGHDLAEGTQLTAFASYGIGTSAVADDSTTYGAGLVLAHLFRPGLAGSLAYRINMREGGVSNTGQPQGDDRAVQNIVTLGLRQSF